MMNASRKRARIPSFLTKLWDIVNVEDDRIVHWSQDGLSFLVHDTRRFADAVLVKYFKTTKFTSFVRQLNFYDFRKIACEDRDVWEFRHPKFIRGREDLISKIRRKTNSEYRCSGHVGNSSGANDNIYKYPAGVQRRPLTVRQRGGATTRNSVAYMGSQATADAAAPRAMPTRRSIPRRTKVLMQERLSSEQNDDDYFDVDEYNLRPKRKRRSLAHTSASQTLKSDPLPDEHVAAQALQSLMMMGREPSPTNKSNNNKVEEEEEEEEEEKTEVKTAFETRKEELERRQRELDLERQHLMRLQEEEKNAKDMIAAFERLHNSGNNASAPVPVVKDEPQMEGQQDQRLEQDNNYAYNTRHQGKYEPKYRQTATRFHLPPPQSNILYSQKQQQQQHEQQQTEQLQQHYQQQQQIQQHQQQQQQQQQLQQQQQHRMQQQVANYPVNTNFNTQGSHWNYNYSQTFQQYPYHHNQQQPQISQVQKQKQQQQQQPVKVPITSQPQQKPQHHTTSIIGQQQQQHQANADFLIRETQYKYQSPEANSANASQQQTAYNGPQIIRSSASSYLPTDVSHSNGIEVVSEAAFAKQLLQSQGSAYDIGNGLPAVPTMNDNVTAGSIQGYGGLSPPTIDIANPSKIPSLQDDKSQLLLSAVSSTTPVGNSINVTAIVSETSSPVTQSNISAAAIPAMTVTNTTDKKVAIQNALINLSGFIPATGVDLDEKEDEGEATTIQSL